MSTANLLITLLLTAAAWSVVASLLIYQALRARGRDTSFLLLRLYIPWYAFEYRKLTKAESGKCGPLFFHWIVSINVALAAAVALMIALA